MLHHHHTPWNIAGTQCDHHELWSGPLDGIWRPMSQSVHRGPPCWPPSTSLPAAWGHRAFPLCSGPWPPCCVNPGLCSPGPKPQNVSLIWPHHLGSPRVPSPGIHHFQGFTPKSQPHAQGQDGPHGSSHVVSWALLYPRIRTHRPGRDGPCQLPAPAAGEAREAQGHPGFCSQQALRPRVPPATHPASPDFPLPS